MEIRPASNFDDVRTLVGPKRPDANVCWCLSYRIPSKQNLAMRGLERGEFVRDLCSRQTAPGVLAYDGGDVVGWAAVAPRADTTFARNRKIPHIDDQPVWSLWCVRVRPGFRKRGIAAPLIAGVVDFARDHGAPVIEAYPVDNGNDRVNMTMAYVGTRKMFEQAGFEKAADTTSVIDGFPRIIMRRAL